jgi:hypothetical protein
VLKEPKGIGGEARSVQGGIGPPETQARLFQARETHGAHAGFITGGAVVVGQDVNFALMPEVPFKLDAFVAARRHRCRRTRGIGLLAAARARDPSGNVKLKALVAFCPRHGGAAGAFA